MQTSKDYVGQTVDGRWCVMWWDAGKAIHVLGAVHHSKRIATAAMREEHQRQAKISAAARALGSIKSARKAATSRANGLKGGRPRHLRGGRSRKT